MASPALVSSWYSARSATSAILRSAPVAEQPQQHHEQVDEVEIERQRTHHGLAASDRSVVHGIIHLLDLLRIPGGEAGEHEDADHRDDPVEPARPEEDVDEARDDDADQAHEQEGANAGEIASGGVATQARTPERAR